MRVLTGGPRRFLCSHPANGSQAAQPHLEIVRLPSKAALQSPHSHNSKTVLAIVKIGWLVEGEVDRDQEEAPHSSLKPVVPNSWDFLKIGFSEGINGD